MTIIVGVQPVPQIPDSVAEIYRRFPVLESDATKLLLKPLHFVDKPEGVLYVTQKEYAVLRSDDDHISIMGTDDATTCHIIVITNRQESTACLAHIDSTDDVDELYKMVSTILGSQGMQSDSCLELSILGGYNDEMHKSEILTLDLLQFYNQLPVKFQLVTFCVGAVNTQKNYGINWPILYGATVSNLCSDFVITPAKFSLNVRGPCFPLRSSRFLCNKSFLQRVYHSQEGVFKINPFNYQYHSQMVNWLQESDDFIRNNFSTSPAVEPDHFSQEMKQVFQFVVQNPFPMLSIFKSNQSVKYVPSPQGQWLKL